MHPWPPSGRNFHWQFTLSDDELLEAHLADGKTREQAEQLLQVVRTFVFPSGPNVSLEDIIESEMKRTGKTRAELNEIWDERQAESVAELARLVALDEADSA